MRKTLVLAIAIVAMATASTASAGSIDYLSNQSADYIRSFSRNASIDGADIISFNPAGTAWLEDGLHLVLSNQTIFKEYKISHMGTDYVADAPTWALPSFHAVFKMDDWAVFAAFTVPAGGGTLIYEEGVPFLKPLYFLTEDRTGGSLDFSEARFEGSSLYLAPTLGGAYRFFDMVSISAAVRALFVSKSYKGGANYGTAPRAGLDAEKTATGFGGIFGLDVSPVEGLHIAARYEMQTALELETTKATTTNLVPADNNALWSFIEGAKEKRDLPQVIGAGIAYRAIEPLNVSVSFQYYMTEQADGADDVEGAAGYTISYDDDYTNGYDIAGAVEYNVMPELLLSVGYNRSVIGGNANTVSDFEYALDSNSIGFGGRYSFLEDYAVTVGSSLTFYEDTSNECLNAVLCLTNQGGPETFSKSVYGLALALAWKPL